MIYTTCQVKPEGLRAALAVYLPHVRIETPDGITFYDATELTREMDCTLEARDGYLLVGTPAMSLAIPIEDALNAVQPGLQAYLRASGKKPEKE